MKRSIIILTFLCLCYNIKAQDKITVSEIYTNAPLTVCPMLTPQTRFEMLEYAKINVFDTIRNFMDGQSWIKYANFNEQHLIINQTQSNTLELKLFNDSLLLVINTLYAPLASSTVSWYDSHWNKIKDVDIEMNNCKDQPATFIKATLKNDSLLLENQSLQQINDLENSEYRSCSAFTTIPLSR